MNRPIIVEETYNSTRELVWEALTIKSKMKEWYFNIEDFELKQGATFNFYEPGDAKAFHHQCTIKEIIVNKKIEHTWTHPSHSKGESLLSWEIFPEGKNTKVRLTHNYIENFADAGKEFERINYEVGWKVILGQMLKDYLEK